MENDLMVEIPKKFKKGLNERINVNNIIRIDGRHELQDGYYYLKKQCPLCIELCDSCPFERFNKNNWTGCSIWINTILGMSLDEKFFTGNFKKYIFVNKIRKLRKLAPKYIKWV